jgi:hypothetical protein
MSATIMCGHPYNAGHLQGVGPGQLLDHEGVDSGDLA